ncbi:hypothetical protein HMPREF9098_2099 [Kingella denitrificans ATCC 33394]|uniref:Uncharacterized protein n=1 Tax=Kingella denitrificans ATCC 33394 TaxID=888741 RepID=F0F1W4_9NEIS|nr:hypothetical protein HMPREF9098_2099 [Kingella denitrificans ATCC 33394]
MQIFNTGNLKGFALSQDKGVRVQAAFKFSGSLSDGLNICPKAV